QDFRKRVIQRFCDSWTSGLTPNPCTVCNRFMKFPALLEKADSLGCEFAATGHYARAVDGVLKQAVTQTGEINPKDQSYMLYALTPSQLSRLVFPLGTLSKVGVRDIAAAHGLANADAPDSQDICFVPNGDYAGFIEEFTGIRSCVGDFVNKNNEVLGNHKGHIHYTQGQRRGLGLFAHNRLYVVGKDARTNTVTVSDSESDLYKSEFTVRDMVWHVNSLPERTFVKIRYSRNMYPCKVETLSADSVRVVLDVPQKAVTPGQCAVFYEGESVVGGGELAIINN
ncbi:MAG: tRNA 2-thiouridine(34) synthase MnmA, partial [Oscillospiraceae bacterium]|nr:tRNA 2-thiouridine(34) synthase MnmA [Oscillospiraceae bacterium]